MNIATSFARRGLNLCLPFACAAGLFGQLPADVTELPAVGSAQLRILTPRLLELTFVTTKKPDPAPVDRFNFINAQQQARLPEPGEIRVTTAGQPVAIERLGFKRRVLYAPLKQRDLRIGNYLYLALNTPLQTNDTVEVVNPSQKLWPASTRLTAKVDPLRWSPLIHVNQTGYLPGQAKKAMIGYYAGTWDELDWWGARSNQPPPGFKLLTSSGQEVFSSRLTPRRDIGFPSSSYQLVLEADFTSVTTPGEYRLWIPELGTSFPFWIDPGIAGAFARCYALGLYHQRCGAANEMPFTRFTHGLCHTAPAQIPDGSKKFENVNYVLNKESEDCKENPRHTAPQLKDVAASLYPFVNRQPIAVTGGHHDAGDYSKYTINSAALIHALVLAADLFPGVSELDNLGLPESGDGKSDVLQEAKWEADFLARMQDADGGFYFLVYPLERRYEDNVLPDKGDAQVVFPKTTAVTAAAVAALAQAASSPVLKRQFPEAAPVYLERARKGWVFLQNALQRYGQDGAYQKITHYGDYFHHDDELAWAACELFLATGESTYHDALLKGFDPADPNTRRWNWLRLFDAYGSAIRSYALAPKAGKCKREQLDRVFLEKCETEIIAAAEDQLRRADSSAYGTSFPEEAKRARSAGWYFSGDAAFDLAVACQLEYPERNDPRPKFVQALISNLNYEQGCNPVNVTYLTGLGWKRQREIVHQYSLNDRRRLPLSGVPLGNIQAGFGWTDQYKQESGALTFPSDGSDSSPYPFYDRWADAFNLTQEFIAVNQARALAYLAWLMAQTPLKTQPWKPVAALIEGLPARVVFGTRLNLSLSAPGLELANARVAWEMSGQEPVLGATATFTVGKTANAWIEAEAQLPDGRRVFASTNFPALPR